MVLPSVWRWEFQQVEKEYMVKKNAGRSRGPHSALGIGSSSHIGVSSAQHGRKAGGLHFAAFALTGLFEMPVIAYFLQSSFAVDLLFQPAQGFVNWLAFF
jgi:hypothetical protein